MVAVELVVLVVTAGVGGVKKKTTVTTVCPLVWAEGSWRTAMPTVAVVLDNTIREETILFLDSVLPLNRLVAHLHNNNTAIKICTTTDPCKTNLAETYPPAQTVGIAEVEMTETSETEMVEIEMVIGDEAVVPTVIIGLVDGVLGAADTNSLVLFLYPFAYSPDASLIIRRKKRTSKVVISLS